MKGEHNTLVHHPGRRLQGYGLQSEDVSFSDTLHDTNGGRRDDSPMWGSVSKNFRFFALFWIAMMSFGGHLSKASMSTFQVYFQEDATLDIGPTHYAMLISAIALPNLLLPLFGGTLFDISGHRRTTIAFLFMALCGQTIFVIGIMINSFPLALVGEFIFGAGNGCTVLAERAIIARQFKGKEVTFALGVSVAVSALSKFVGRAMVAPIATEFGSYVAALWATCLFICLSVVCAFVYWFLSAWLERQPGHNTHASAPAHTQEAQAETSARKHVSIDVLITQAWKLPASFWAMAGIHTLYIMVYHMFINFSASFIREKWNTSVAKAGYISSLVTLIVVFVAPLSGFAMDWVGGRLYVMILAGVLTLIAFGYLAFSMVTPIVGVLLLSVSESFIPTISMALIPEVTALELFGIAFGMIEVLDAIANLSGNLFMGGLREATQSYESGMISIFVLSAGGCMLLIGVFIWDRWWHDSILNTSQLRLKYQALGDVSVTQTPATLAMQAPMQAQEMEVEIGMKMTNPAIHQDRGLL